MKRIKYKLDKIGFVSELGLILTAYIFINSMNIFQVDKEFSWLGLLALISGILLSLLFLYARNLMEIKK